MRCNIILVYLSVWRYKSGTNPSQLSILVIFQMPLFMPLDMCQVRTAVLVCSHYTCLIVLSGLWGVGAPGTVLLFKIYSVQGRSIALYRSRDAPLHCTDPP